MLPYNPIICALDTVSVEKAVSLTKQIAPHVGAIKLGLEFFVANGAVGVQALEALQVPIFLDLKFHDIPNTVAKAITATAGIRPFMMTIHTSGGPEMMRRAADAGRELSTQTGQARPLIVGVTALTSLDQSDLHAVGIASSVGDQVQRLASLAQENGLDGVVCSPHEIALLRRTCGEDFVLVVPGIRPAGSDAGDQKRIMTPPEAVALGASYLVIGRPITDAADPEKAAQAIEDSFL